ncbi:MAG TPA: ATPase domain-containing protein [Candidatus Thermoplasmatota archaeon]|nr:ATPase domain-containing protein [Candidatus Thermoplasmatota archaeon]
MALIQTDNKTTVGKIERVKTGINGLDELLSGGLPKESITLVSGPPGSGKSIFCYQFLAKGVEEGKKCLYLTLDKKIEGLLLQAAELGIHFDSAIQSGQIKFLFLNINKKLIYESMINEILSGNYDRVVLDSITPLSEMPIYLNNPEFTGEVDNIDHDEISSGNFPVRRLHLHYIMNALETARCTAVVTSELPSGSTNYSRDGISEFLADGVIILSLDPTMDRRKLTVMKMRSTKHTLRPQNMEIGKGGMQII